MDRSKKRHRRNEDTIPCECGCKTLIYKYGMDGRMRRFAAGHQFKGNKYGAKSYNLSEILKQAEAIQPLCKCGCQDKLDIPNFLRKKGKGIQSIQSYWKKNPYKKGHGIWDLRSENFINSSEQLQKKQLGLIYGTLLGDGSIDYPNSYS